jgi:hypothetical protein
MTLVANALQWSIKRQFLRYIASRIPFARLRISEDARVGTQVRLTRQGAELFGGAYDESEPLDDLALPVSAARAVLATFARLETAHPDSNGSRDRAPHNP